jgi:hypothetical protein
MTLSVPELLLPEVQRYGTTAGLAKTAKIILLRTW